MKTLRIVLLSLLFCAGFVWVTSRTHLNLRSLAAPVMGRVALWTEPESARGAGLSPDELNNIEVYKLARLATVYITSTTVKRDIFFQPYPERYLGSGFIINDQGSILTNYHVVSGSRRIQVTLGDQSVYDAKSLDIDRSDDLALIKITPKKKLPFLRLGDSEKLQVGQKVLAIGNPFGLEGTLTTGVVSSIGRVIQSESNVRLEGMIQTDAAINGGNSGGPLLNSLGDVIGINTAIVGERNSGVGFALPINRAKALLGDYQAGRVTERPKLGIESVLVAGSLATALNLPEGGGLLVQTVEQGSSADAAGIRGARAAVMVGNEELGVGGDLILAADGQAADRVDALIRLMSRKRVGDTLDLTIYRDGRTIRVPVRLLRAPENQDGGGF